MTNSGKAMSREDSNSISIPYAKSGWIFHARNCSQNAVEELSLKFFSDKDLLQKCSSAKDSPFWIPLFEAGFTPLMTAAAFGLENTCLKMLQQHPDLEIRDNFNFTALHYAVCGGHANVVEILLNHGANIEERGNYGYTPLHMAIDAGNEEMIVWLLQHGADVNAGNPYYGTALHMAVSYDSLAIVRLLLAEPKIDAWRKDHDNPYGITVLEYAMSRPDKADVVALLRPGFYPVDNLQPDRPLNEEDLDDQ